MKFLLHFILFFSASFYFGFEAFSAAKEAEKAVWKIHRPWREPQAGVTGFFIEKNLVVTSFYVISDLLKRNPERPITLTQGGGSSSIKVKKILALSILYDIALLETETEVENFLEIREEHPEASENLLVLGYPGGRKLKQIKKTGSILLEDSQSYIFPVNNSDLGYLRVSPVLDNQGRVAGVSFGASDNILSVMKADYLKKFIAGKEGSNCSEIVSVKKCMEKEIENLKKLIESGKGLSSFPHYIVSLEVYYREIEEGLASQMDQMFKGYKKLAEEGVAFSQGMLAWFYREGISVEKDSVQAFKWFQSSAEQGYVVSQYHLAEMYQKGEGIKRNLKEVMKWLQKAANQGYAPAQHDLAFMYSEGLETERDFEEALKWYRKSADQGYAPAQYALAYFWLSKAAKQGHPEALRIWNLFNRR